jgi:hypothetical protein
MREIVRRHTPREARRQAKPDLPVARMLALQRTAGNHAVTRMLARQAAAAADLPAIADNLKRFRSGAPRLRALAGRPAPAIDAKALDLAPALAWLAELADTLKLVEPLADPTALVFESTVVTGHDGDYGQAETQIAKLLPATLAIAAPAARELGTRVRDAVVAAINRSSVVDHGPGTDPDLLSKDRAIAWREHATTLASLAPKVDKTGALKDAALVCEDAALAILQARAVAEARTTWRAGTVRSSGSPTAVRDELDDVFADSGYGQAKVFEGADKHLADWCGMFAGANLFRASAFDKQLRMAFAHTDNLFDFFNYTANVNPDRTPLSIWAEGQWWSVKAYHEARGLKRKAVLGPDAAADIRPGDIALIRHDGVKPASALANHIVMVESYDAVSGTLITIEGNVTQGIRPDADGTSQRTGGGDLKWSTAASTSTVIEKRNMRDETSTTHWGQPAGDVYQPSGRRTVWFVGRPSLIDFEQHEYATAAVPEQYKYLSPAQIRKTASAAILQTSSGNRSTAAGPYHKRVD